MQKIASGFSTATANYWDGDDATVFVQWPKEPKKDPQRKMVRAFATILAISF